MILRDPGADVFDTAAGGQLFVGVVGDQRCAAFVAVFELGAIGANAADRTNDARVQARAVIAPAVRPAAPEAAEITAFRGAGRPARPWLYAG